MVDAAKMSYNSKFTMDKMRYDVGIVKLSEDLVLSETVKPVELVPVGSSPKTGSKITLTGWGVTKVRGRQDRVGAEGER